MNRTDFKSSGLISAPCSVRALGRTRVHLRSFKLHPVEASGGVYAARIGKSGTQQNEHVALKLAERSSRPLAKRPYLGKPLLLAI